MEAFTSNFSPPSYGFFYSLFNKPNIFLASAVFTFLLLVSCTPEDKTAAYLLGHWEVVHADRNGKPTLTLQDAFFEFQNDSIMVTNILRDERAFGYHLEDKKIMQNGPVPINYEIDYLEPDSLVLTTVISSYHFQFYLRKQGQATD